ncbi:hypothetical protein Natpe_1870 [Natrinema pellirubrum DSM 15624]|uniref:Uncharacterized protein n=1 Tax=Natrinema pellirubrum (strain DSM 15624 / CIP 106293 / JCM 10476 / NCIMB 786 / 157) TaxID=797303 RepID=L0JKC8_NATP1|nr:rod-determining factor RdfA [Natrinema pellirubrum]AGB31734.1 hypothetical protein Natpe_1870 [Natrinema pellirubrum DSM 15624]
MNSDSQPCCKIGRITQDYHIPNLDRELLKRRDQGDSLRDLATYLNKQILSVALSSATREVIGDADSIYDVLRGDGVSRSRRAELRSKLSRNDVDIDSIEEDFVSHQTVRNHLHDCEGIDTGRESTADIDGARKTIEWAQARSEGVIEETLERLRNADEISDVPTEVTQSVRVGCSACGSTYRIEDYLDQGGCDCQTSNEPS